MSERAPRVSVLVATRDRPVYLVEALHSVLAGSYQDFEIVVTDDAGVAENRAAVASFHDPRIHYCRNQLRLGSARNHCTALRVARGQYVAMLNDDDQWEPQLLSTLVPTMDRHPVVVAFADHHVMDAAGVLDAPASKASSQRWKRASLAASIHQPFQRLAVLDQSVATVAALFRRDALDSDDCPAEVASAFDLWVCYRLSRDGSASYYVPERLARYRAHPSSVTAAGGAAAARAAVFVYQQIFADPRMASLRRDLRARLGAARVTYALALLADGDAAAARAALRGAFAPRSAARALLTLALSYLPPRRGAAMLRALRAARRPRFLMLP